MFSTPPSGISFMFISTVCSFFGVADVASMVTLQQLLPGLSRILLLL